MKLHGIGIYLKLLTKILFTNFLLITAISCMKVEKVSFDPSTPDGLLTAAASGVVISDVITANSGTGGASCSTATWDDTSCLWDTAVWQ